MAKWIQKAIKHPGSFNAAAKRAHMSPGAFERKVLAPGSRASPTMKRKANLRRTLRKLGK